MQAYKEWASEVSSLVVGMNLIIRNCTKLTHSWSCTSEHNIMGAVHLCTSAAPCLYVSSPNVHLSSIRLFGVRVVGGACLYLAYGVREDIPFGILEKYVFQKVNNITFLQQYCSCRNCLHACIVVKLLWLLDWWGRYSALQDGWPSL